MPAFDFSGIGINNKYSCEPANGPDLYTNCYVCGDNAKNDYEQCRQSFYLDQQNNILSNNNQKTEDLEKIINQQNEHIFQLLKNYEKTTENVDNLNFINNILIVFLAIIFLTFLFIKLLKRRKINK